MEQVVPTVAVYGPDLIGVLLPPVIEILNKDIPEDRTTERFLASIAICMLVAVILRWTDLMTGSPEQVITSFGLIFTESQIVYKTYFKDSFIRAKIRERLQPEDDQPLG